jgi:glycosyltransferase involved in cell wall biosynthesis
MILQSGRALSIEEQFNWLKSGVNSKALYQHIADNCKNFDLIIFGPYLFPITFWGALICPEKSILLPCLHDEQYAYQDCFREMFKKVRGVFFNSLPEKELADRIYQLSDLTSKGHEVGMGFPKAETIESKSTEKYLLYSGRKESGKGLDFLLSCYESLPEEQRREEIKLYLIGSGKIDFREELPVGVVDLGFVSEEDKYKIMSNALALVHPSLNESFSIVLMESWLHQTPVIVRKECAVLKHHVEVSGGGLWFSDIKSFKATINALLTDPALSMSLADHGKEFVESYYSWEAVSKRLDKSLRSLGF